MRGNEK